MQRRACFDFDTWSAAHKCILWWWHFLLESHSLACISQGTHGAQLTPPNEGINPTIYTNTTTAAKPSLCFCNKTLSSTPITLVQHNPRQPSPGISGCYTGIPRRSGAASQAAASLLFYAFLRTEGREGRGVLLSIQKAWARSTNLSRCLHSHRFHMGLGWLNKHFCGCRRYSSIAMCGTQTNPFNCSRHQLPTADTG